MLQVLVNTVASNCTNVANTYNIASTYNLESTYSVKSTYNVTKFLETDLYSVHCTTKEACFFEMYMARNYALHAKLQPVCKITAYV